MFDLEFDGFTIQDLLLFLTLPDGLDFGFSKVPVHGVAYKVVYRIQSKF